MNQIEKYFKAEQNESVLFVMVGIVAVAIAMYFLIKIKHPIYTGLAYPLIAIALIQIVVGCMVYLRSPKDIVRVNEIIQTDKARIHTEEIPRMEEVMKNFNTYKWIEISFILVGIVMFFYFKQPSMLKGIGLGLFIQAGFLLLLDFFAERRGTIYLEYLNTIL